MRAALRPLGLPAFRRLAFVRFVDELGDWLGEIALAVLVFDRTGSPMATAALFLGLQFVPAFATPPLVARLEALPSRVALAALNALQAAVFAGLALLAPNFSLVAVIALGAIGSALAISGRALTRAAAVAVSEPHGLLREGNAVLNVAFTAGAAAGPAVAGAVVAGAGAQTALFADAVSFAVVALLLATVSGLPRAQPEVAGWADRLRRALAYVRERPQLRLLIAAQAVAFVFFTIVIPIEVVFAKETLDAGDLGYGALLASWGAGMVLGSLAFALLRRVSLRVLLPLATMAVGVAYLLTGAAPSLAFACAASVLGGAGNGIEWVALVTAVQQLTRAEYQARVASLVESVAKAAPGIGFLLGGATAALFNPRVSYAVAGVGVLAVLAVAAGALARAGWRGEPPVELDLEETLREAAGAPQISDSISVSPVEAPGTAPETASR
jgi:MFS family permease